VAVDLDVEAGEAGLDLDSHVRARGHDQRRSVTAVHRERRAHQGRHAGRQHGPAGGHRVGARPEWARHDQTVAGEPHVQLVVDGQVHDDLSGSAAHHDEVVERPLGRRVGGMDRKRRKSPCRPVPGQHALKRGLQAIGMDGGERAEASAGHAQNRSVLMRRCT
jgi:hypothetical protein